jgi:hypothetical protein
VSLSTIDRLDQPTLDQPTREHALWPPATGAERVIFRMPDPRLPMIDIVSTISIFVP